MSKQGVFERALFVIDRRGVIFWSYRSPIAVNPGADGILDALEKMPKQEVAVWIDGTEFNWSTKKAAA